MTVCVGACVRGCAAVHFVDAIPKNPSGKILRRVLKERLTAPAPAAAGAGGHAHGHAHGHTHGHKKH
jgi:hypothetical protein